MAGETENKALTLTINEIYESIQGESSWAGLRCVFVRLTFCNLRCSYCDTEYAFYDGSKVTLDEIVEKVLAFDCPLVELTGGEPLLQRPVHPLMERLCDAGKTVLIETSGALDISGIDSRVHRIMDLKTPSSGGVGAESHVEHRSPHEARRGEIRYRQRTGLRLVEERYLGIRSYESLPVRFVSRRCSERSSRRKSSRGFCGTSSMSVFSFRCTSSSGNRRRDRCEKFSAGR